MLEAMIPSQIEITEAGGYQLVEAVGVRRHTPPDTFVLDQALAPSQITPAARSPEIHLAFVSGSSSCLNRRLSRCHTPPDTFVLDEELTPSQIAMFTLRKRLLP
ncbi:MAG: hypothetical protein E2O61_06235 [Gammaproteobacteria bacterium]|nr:MAG: hypothetical protein E2O61_06235 [Gammaproteobacteria bacterium]